LVFVVLNLTQFVVDRRVRTIKEQHQVENKVPIKKVQSTKRRNIVF
jgi:hypothetical protein